MIVLAPREGRALEEGLIRALYQDHGRTKADQIVLFTTREISVFLARVEEFSFAGGHDDLRMLLGSLSAIARQIGMVDLAEVAHDVLGCHKRGDEPAFVATLARLIRLGDVFLSAVWEIENPQR